MSYTKKFYLHSLNILALLVYCYLGTVKADSAIFNVSLCSTIAIAIYFLTTAFLLYKNWKVVYRTVFGSRKILFLVALALVATLLTRTTIFLFPLLFALTAIGQDLRRLVKHYLFWSVLLFFGLMILQLVGLITGGEVAQEDGSVEVMAQSLGFGNPNSAFTYLFSILVAGYVLLYRSHRKIIFTAFALALIVGIYVVTLSRTGLICCLLVMLFAHLGRFIRWKMVKKALPAIFIILVLVSIVLAVRYGEMGNAVNDLLSNRPYWWSIRVEDGALSNILGNADSFAKDYAWWLDSAPLDSFFLRIWFTNGLLILVMYFVFFRLWAKGIYSEMLVYGTLVALLYGFSEYGIMANPGRNIILLLMMVPIFSATMTTKQRTLLGEAERAR